VAKKTDPAKAARRKFVQLRMAATGKTDAESKAKFQARFDTLAKTKEGRQTIAKKTGVAGVRKALASTNKSKSSSTGRRYAKVDAAAITKAWKDTVSQPGFSVRTTLPLSSLNITPQIQASVDANIGNMDPKYSGYTPPSPTTTIPSRMQNPDWYYMHGGSPEDYTIMFGDPDKKKKGK
jgi:hypothetical protein